jgi:hypothetical protein
MTGTENETIQIASSCPAEVPGIHEFTSKTWMAETSPAMTKV